MVVFADRKSWIFDLDNTLADSAIDFTDIRQKLGLPLGRPILEEIDTRPAAEAAALHRRLAALERDYARRATPLAGAEALLAGLAGAGARLGILTRNSRDNAFETLQVCGLTSFFAERDVLGRDEAAPKPDPEGIVKLLANWQAGPQTAVMVGDYRFDLEAGRSAGVATVYYDPQQSGLWNEWADARVQDHGQLLALAQSR